MEIANLFTESLSCFPLILGYAEIHYHLKYLFPRYYRREPEIIADVPRRCIRERTSKLPVLLIIKDSHLFPVKIISVTILIVGKRQEVTGRIELNLLATQKYFSKLFYVDLNKFETEQWLHVSVEIEYKIKGKIKKVINDNYPDIPHAAFRCFWTEYRLPFPSGWYCGEPHYHSIHTSDQVEFGADVFSTKIMARAMGLDWMFVTDHSYDLDDCEDDCTKNDPELPIWKKMQEDCLKFDAKDFRIIAGEEVSIGNNEDKNVHLLVINHPHFIAGCGDSAEKWFRNFPQNSLKMIGRLQGNNSLFIAAHPFEKIPFLQKITLRRGEWNAEDFDNARIEFLQGINGKEDIQSTVSAWTELLLQDKRYYLVAGNDAHGNFNVMRQIKSPFWKLFSSQKQTFGNFFTAFSFPTNDPIAGLRNKNIIVSNGPFLSFRLQKDNTSYNIGSQIPPGKVKLDFVAESTPEFGEIEQITLSIGQPDQKLERKFHQLRNLMELTLPEKGYVRLELKTQNQGFAFTNPIWVEKQ